MIPSQVITRSQRPDRRQAGPGADSPASPGGVCPSVERTLNNSINPPVKPRKHGLGVVLLRVLVALTECLPDRRQDLACLNVTWFLSPEDVGAKIEASRKE